MILKTNRQAAESAQRQTIRKEHAGILTLRNQNGATLGSGNVAHPREQTIGRPTRIVGYQTFNHGSK